MILSPTGEMLDCRVCGVKPVAVLRASLSSAWAFEAKGAGSLTCLVALSDLWLHFVFINVPLTLLSFFSAAIKFLIFKEE